jgi:hypothetical protein
MRTDPEEFIEEFFQLRPSCIVPLEPAEFIKISFILVDVYGRYVEPDASLRDQAYSFSQFLPLVEKKLVG